LDIDVVTNTSFKIIQELIFLSDLSSAAWQYEKLGYITNSMVIVNILHAIYVVDFFINEDWYLRTIDICHDHFGFYLGWGSIVWLPTMYTIQAQWLVHNPVSLPPLVAAGILATGLGGYFIFRSVNHQKDIVRQTTGKCLIWGRPAGVLKCIYETTDGKQHQSLLLYTGKSDSSRVAGMIGLIFVSRLVGLFSSCKLPGRSYPFIQHVRYVWSQPSASMVLRYLYDNLAPSSLQEE